jgi:transposase-like protein
MVFIVPKTRPPYPDEFRREALQMLRAGRTPRELGEALGVSEQTLRNWRRQDEREERRRLRRENARLKQERDLFKRAPAFFAAETEDPVSIYRMISAEKATGFPVSVACALLGVSRSAYYDWERGAPSDRALTDAWRSSRSRRSMPPTAASTAGDASTPSCASPTACACPASASDG